MPPTTTSRGLTPSPQNHQLQTPRPSSPKRRMCRTCGVAKRGHPVSCPLAEAKASSRSSRKKRIERHSSGAGSTPDQSDQRPMAPIRQSGFPTSPDWMYESDEEDVFGPVKPVVLDDVSDTSASSDSRRPLPLPTHFEGVDHQFEPMKPVEQDSQPDTSSSSNSAQSLPQRTRSESLERRAEFLSEVTCSSSESKQSPPPPTHSESLEDTVKPMKPVEQDSQLDASSSSNLEKPLPSLNRSESLGRRAEFLSGVSDKAVATIFVVSKTAIEEIVATARIHNFYADYSMNDDQEDSQALVILARDENAFNSLLDKVENGRRKAVAVKTAASAAVVDRFSVAVEKNESTCNQPRPNSSQRLTATDTLHFTPRTTNILIICPRLPISRAAPRRGTSRLTPLAQIWGRLQDRDSPGVLVRGIRIEAATFSAIPAGGTSLVLPAESTATSMATSLISRIASEATMSEYEKGILFADFL
ncbi:hypothetical protein GALMADRAFT_278745 [Galerina marginata CBS 339.88]|uniref:Uncharacterized protein n=1 Tax=Galerina marginata (strain CBS 339.88) TaxID=685588 RepID=A0A067T3C2_GALM3|nr:hypothetical protein GALMADRAFT_278745 [Galerina marginata CBS 339.88]